MSSPPATPARAPRSPSAPLADDVALVDATLPPGQATPGRLDAAVSALSLFPASSPRRVSQRSDRPSGDDKDDDDDGSLPPRKRPDLSATPSRRPTTSTAAASPSIDNLPPNAPPAGVTPSPAVLPLNTVAPADEAPNAAAFDAVRPSSVLTAKGRARADRKQQQAENAHAAEAKRRRKPIKLGRGFVNFTRPCIFDDQRFRPGQPPVYAVSEMDTFDAAFEKQLTFNFSQRRSSHKKLMAEQRVSRSAILDVDHDVAAHNVTTTDFRDLSRYVMEDMVAATAGTRFLVCISKDADFSGTPMDVARDQRKHGVAGDMVRIFGRLYYNLLGWVSVAASNDAVRLGMSVGQFDIAYFNDSGGFVFSFDASGHKLTFSWRDVVEHSSDVMFFGRKFEGARLYDEYLFKNKTNRQYIHHVFRLMSSELVGDALACTQLYACYQKRMRRSLEHQLQQAAAAQAGLFNRQTFNTPLGQLFRKLFNGLCKNSFLNCMSRFQDYTQPIISNADFICYLELARKVFSDQWRFLAGLRSVNANNDSPELTAYKERQVFCQLLALQRVANYKELTHWALIQTTCFYANGVRAIVTNQGRFQGITMGTSFRDAQYSVLAKSLFKLRVKMLAKIRVANFVYDNVTSSSMLRDSRGQSTKFLNATHMAVHQVTEFTNRSFDSLHVANTYCRNQIQISPSGMRQYENVDVTSVESVCNVILDQDSLPKIVAPDLTGSRCRAYNQLSKLATFLFDIEKNFHVPDSHFNICPTKIKRKPLKEMCALVRRPTVQRLLQNARNFRRIEVDGWNERAKHVTQSLLLGVSGVDEKDAEGATAVLMELATVHGMITVDADNMISKTDVFNHKSMIMNGDRKTHECTESFQSLAADRNMSLEEKSRIAEITLDVFDRCLFAPGDWHTGMNMMQGLYNIYWHMILKHMKKWLKIARLSKDVRNCYFEASRLILFCNREFARYLWHDFISENYHKYRADLHRRDDVVVVTQIAVDFQSHLREGHKNTVNVDEHFKMICGFILLVNNFRDFVDSYRQQDSIGIEQGYTEFAPVWKCNGQSKYLQCWIEHLHQLNEKHPFSLVQTYRCHRVHRSYPKSSGKSCTTIDEKMEISNRDLSILPKNRTVDGFVRQGALVGPCVRTKRFVEGIMGPGLLGERTIYRTGTGSKNNLTPEKQLIYEVASLFLEKSRGAASRLLSPLAIISLEDQVKGRNNLKRTKLVQEIHGDPDDEAYRVLSVIRDSYTSFSSKRSTDQATAQVAADQDMDAVDDEEEEDNLMRIFEGTQMTGVEDEAYVEEETDNTLHPYLLADIKSEGWQSIEQMDIPAVRDCNAQRRKRKRLLTKYVLKKVKELREESHTVDLSTDIQELGMAPWRQYMIDLNPGLYRD